MMALNIYSGAVANMGTSMMQSLSRILTKSGFARDLSSASKQTDQLEISRQGSQGKPHGLTLAACILERLPIVMPSAQPWEVEHKLWARSQDLLNNFAKEYPVQTKKEGRESVTTVAATQDLRTFEPVPCTTSSDVSGDMRSMKRCLDKKLYLLVKQKSQWQGAGTDAIWQFPTVEHNEGESIRQTGERALASTIGRAYPIFFIGNAPMAHLPSTQIGNTTFFMLAQVVGDPWQVKLKGDSGCTEAIWVTKEEMIQYIKDPRMSDLIPKML